MEQKNEIGGATSAKEQCDRVNTVPYDPFADSESSSISIPRDHFTLMVGAKDYIFFRHEKTGLYRVGLLTKHKRVQVVQFLSAQDVEVKKADQLARNLFMQNMMVLL